MGQTKYFLPVMELPPLQPWDFVDLLTAVEWLKSGGVHYRPIGLRRLAELGRIPGAVIVRNKWRLPRVWVEAAIRENSPEGKAARLLDNLSGLAIASPFDPEPARAAAAGRSVNEICAYIFGEDTEAAGG